ncbi:tyrosine-type recombinase/integrase [Clostridium akagii]|uniref:tyrosine-type recombinase/integrase n=1 Tax=Clostridium akagii TaxID=91623 RepID=UPI00047B918C|nr:site-specific integrase [Clostridium akagii]
MLQFIFTPYLLDCSLLISFFNYAVDEGYLIKNPCIGKKIVILGQVENKEHIVEIFTNKEIKLLFTALENHRLKALILLDLGTGLRKGELLGLKWSDIDFDNKQLKVERNVKKVYIIAADGNKEYKTIDQTPKSTMSTRSVPIPSSLLPILKQHSAVQKQEKLNDLFI